jgi:hypothetical protein
MPGHNRKRSSRPSRLHKPTPRQSVLAHTGNTTMSEGVAHSSRSPDLFPQGFLFDKSESIAPNVYATSLTHFRFVVTAGRAFVTATSNDTWYI